MAILKKWIYPVLLFLYNILSLLWGYIFLQSVLWRMTSVRTDEEGMTTFVDIAGVPVFELVFWFSFIALSVGILLLCIVAAIKKKKHHKLNVCIGIGILVNAFIFRLIPPQMYMIELYLVVLKIPLARYASICYSILAVAAALVLFLCNTKERSRAIS